MLEDSIKIHDNFQFQVKLAYDIKKKNKMTEYLVDTFIFLPKTLGINKHTYTRKEFYSDMHSFIRYKTPIYSLSEIASGKGPLEMIRQGRDFEFHVKLFCCILKSALRDYVSDAKNADVRNYIRYISMIRESYRSLDVPEEQRQAYSFGDEDLSLLIDSYSYYLIANMPKGDNRNKVTSLVRSEQDYRIAKKYPSIPVKGQSNELYLFRKNILKKYVESSLYLSTAEGKEGKVIDSIVSGAAAGLAMVFATAVTYYAQLRFGSFTMSFFVAIVLGYIFKDRIKESIKAYLKYTTKKNFFDHKTKIYAGEKNIGIIKESFDYEDEKNLPENVILLRNRDHMTEIEDSWLGETILRYSKKIWLMTDKLELKGFSTDAINDISRLNINRFMDRMGTPDHTIYCLDKKDVIKIKGRKVSHINIIMRFMSGSSVMYKRLRLIVNRNGIQSIEEVHSVKENILVEKKQWKNFMKHVPVKIHLPRF